MPNHSNAKPALTALVICLIITLFCHFAATNAVGQELRQLRNAVRSSPPPDSEDDKRRGRDNNDDRHHHHHHHGFCDCNDDDDLESQAWAGLGWVIGAGLTAPVWGPVIALEDDYDVAGYFPKYPYKGQLDGHMMMDPWVPERPFPWSARLSVENGNDFDSISNWNTKFLLETSSRWGVDSEITYRSEKLMPGVKDELYTGDLNLVMRFAQSERWQFRGGMGVNWLADGDDDYGVNFTYGFDYYPGAPWVFSNEIDWGRLGNVHLLHLRSTAGVMIHGGELFIGVDYYDVGPVETTTMISGLRIWF